MIRYAILLILTLLPATVVTAEKSAPSMNVGDTWTYQIETSARSYREVDTVVGLRDCGGVQCYILHSESQGETTDYWMSQDWELIRNSGTSTSGSYNFTYSPPLPIYVFPLEVGKSWSWNSTFSGTLASASESQNYTGTIVGISRRVASKATVTVPAGDFETFLVEHLDDTHVTRRLWFGEQVREAVKFEFYERGTMVLTGSLISYTLAQGVNQFPLEYIALGVTAVGIVAGFLTYKLRRRGKVTSSDAIVDPSEGAVESEA